MRFVHYLAVMSLTSCAIKNDGRKASKPVTTQSTNPQEARLPQAIAVALEDPNAFAVNLTWPLANDVEGWVIERQDNADGSVIRLASLPVEVLEYVDTKPKPGAIYGYRIMAVRAGALVPLHQMTITLPKDMVVSGTQVLNTVNGFHRLFLDEGSILRTEGQNLTIQVQEIVARGGWIESFADNQTASPGSTGRHGGAIKVIADRLTGTLKVIGRGEGGGSGAPGLPGAPGTVGAPGQATKVRKVRLGSPADGAVRLVEWCQEFPTPGGSGSPGSAGGPGSSGFAGGNGAKIEINIAQATRDQLDVHSLPGNGGKGGPGGPKGKGGPGGPPGYWEPSYQGCAAANSGPPGPDGIDGSEGPTGLAGTAFPVCLTLASKPCS